MGFAPFFLWVKAALDAVELVAPACREAASTVTFSSSRDVAIAARRNAAILARIISAEGPRVSGHAKVGRA